MSYYYTDPSNQPIGPVSLDELTELRRAGRIGDDSPVIEEGTIEWRACRDFVALAALPWTPPSPPVPAPVVLGLHPQRLSIAVVAALGMLATFLPWYYLPVIGAVSGTHDESWWIVVALFIPALLLAFSGEKRGPLSIKKGLVAAVPAALAACLAISAILNLYAKKASFDNQGVLAQAVASTAQVGIGPYLMLAAGVGLVLIACLVPLYWRTSPETFVRWCAIVATIVGIALFVRLQLGHGLLIGAMLGAAIVGVVWLLLAAWRIFGHHGRSRWIAVFVVATIGLLGVFLLGKLFSPGKTPVPGEHAVASTVTNLPASTASTSWHYVLYKGRRADYRLVVPSYFQEAQSSLDSDVDRSFVGPGGIVVSAYTVADTNRFWDDMRTSHGLRGVEEAGETHTYQSRSGDAVTEQSFKVTGDAVGGQQLLLVLIIVRPNLTYALAVYVPDIWPERVRIGAGWNLGMIAGATHRLEVGQQSPDDLTKPHDNLEANLYEELAAAGWHPGYSSTDSTQDQRPTRAQWKNKVSKNFGWLPGVPVTAQASRFQQVMGKPDDTQTLGDQTLWYYRCADGTIQLAMSALNLQTAGYMQAEVNDY